MMDCQPLDVFGALSERRSFEMKCLQSVKQIATECPFSCHGIQFAIGGGDEAKIDLDFLPAAYRS